MQRSTRTKADAPDPEHEPRPNKERYHVMSDSELFQLKRLEANEKEAQINWWGRRLKARFKRQDPSRDEATLDNFVGQDPIWRQRVGQQQFANREAQMYGIGAIMEYMRIQNELLSSIDLRLQLQNQMLLDAKNSAKTS